MELNIKDCENLKCQKFKEKSILFFFIALLSPLTVTILQGSVVDIDIGSIGIRVFYFLLGGLQFFVSAIISLRNYLKYRKLKKILSDSTPEEVS